MTEFEKFVFSKDNPFLIKRSQHAPTHHGMGSSSSSSFEFQSSLEELVQAPTPSRPRSRFLRLFYWEPPEDSWLQEFCGSSVIHGLKYISRKKLNLFERIFWAGAFFATLYASWLMIDRVWERYHKSPVIVTFTPMEYETSWEYVCSWDNKKTNCSDLFKPIITDYGKCCVFNKIPSYLMLFERDEVPNLPHRERGWTPELLQEWAKWNYEDGFIITDDQGLKYPMRQKRTGNMYGLSVLVDPDVEDGYCQSQDSHGIRILLHTPADMPRIEQYGTGFGLEKEIYMKVFPDSTIAEPSLLDYEPEQRKCIFGKGSSFKDKDGLEKPYTRNNCFIACQQKHIREQCNCTMYYAPRMNGWRICDPSSGSKDSKCVHEIERTLASNQRRYCEGCVYGCNYLKYHTESTEATLLDPEDLWGDNETQSPPPWANKKLSIIHVFMGSDVNVPKLRQKLYSPVDLIASIGGLLGLTWGFSVLAAIEILYLLTLRLCCKRFRSWHMSGESG